MEVRVQAELQRILDDELRWVLDSKEGDDYYCTYPANYRDKISSSDIKEIFQSDDPDTAFYETIDAPWYWFIATMPDNTVDNVKLAWDEDVAKWDEVEDEITAYIDEHVHWQPDYRHYLDQKVNVDILIDTGDGNYDYVLNCVYPEDDEINDKAALMWLTEQMGYTKEQLNKARKGTDFGGSAYLKSVEQELANRASDMQQLVFLVSMTLGECLQLNQRIAASQNPEFRYEPWRNTSEDWQLYWQAARTLRRIASRRTPTYTATPIVWMTRACSGPPIRKWSVCCSMTFAVCGKPASVTSYRKDWKDSSRKTTARGELTSMPWPRNVCWKTAVSPWRHGARSIGTLIIAFCSTTDRMVRMQTSGCAYTNRKSFWRGLRELRR